MSVNRGFLCLAAVLLVNTFGHDGRPLPAQQPAAESGKTLHPFASDEEAVRFLRTAKIVASKRTGQGITNPRRLTLDDGKIRHDAVFKSIDDRRFGLTQLPTGPEMDFKDSWKFEIAAYELDKILSLGMVPPTVERSYLGKKGSLQLWLDNCMLESDRLKNNLHPPNPALWNQQMYKVRIFDNLIYNIDRNLRNLLVSPDWRCYMIDHSRSFKSVDMLKSPQDMTYFSVSFMKALEGLDEKLIEENIGDYLNPGEISNLLKRRDMIVELYSKMTAEKGTAITYP